LASGDVNEALACIEELQSPEYHKNVIYKGIMTAVEKKERQRDDMIRLFDFLHAKNIVTVEDFEKGFTRALEIIEDIDIDIPYASKFLSTFIGNAMAYKNSITLSFLEHSLDHLVETEKAPQIVAGILFTLLNRFKNEDTIAEMWENAKLDFAKFFPVNQQTPETIQEFLQEKGLSFLIAGGKVEEDIGSEEPNQEDIILKQTADGFWRLNEELASILDVSEENLKSSVPSILQDQPDKWATILALEYLQLNFRSTADEWELIASKALSWLSLNLGSDVKLEEELKGKAQHFLQKK